MKTLIQDIKNRTFRPVYLLYGDEEYLKQQYEKKLREALVPPDDTINLSVYEGKGIDVQELISQAETMPFFAERRLLVVKNSGFFKNASPELAEYLTRLPDTACILFSEEEVDKRGKLFKTVKKVGYAAEFAKQTEDTLFRWILGILKREGKNLTRSTLELFLEKTGTDMTRISTELEKLLCYTLGREIITSEDVEAICSGQTTNRIFEMINAAAEKRRTKALEYYYDLLALKEPPMRILYLMVRQLNLILQISELQSQGLGREEIAGKMGIQSFIVRNTSRQTGTYTPEQLRGILERAAAAEEAVKTGRLDDRLAVELILIEMSGENKKTAG